MTTSIFPFGFLFLDVRGIKQEHFREISSRLRRIDRPTKSKCDQPGKQAGMIDMRVRQYDEVKCPRRKTEVKRRKITAVSLAAPLKHATINQQSHSGPFEQETRTRYFASSAKKANLHGWQGFFSGRFRPC